MTHFSPGSTTRVWLFDLQLLEVSAPRLRSGSPTFCGFQWHRRQDARFRWADSPRRTLFWQPRFGVAYDLIGKGNTVLRGGWGRFYYHSGQFTNGLGHLRRFESITITPTTIGSTQHNLLASNLSSIRFQCDAVGAVGGG